MKGKTTANSSVQRSCMLKAEASSPAVATESLLLNEVINAKENCVVMTLDVLNALT